MSPKTRSGNGDYDYIVDYYACHDATVYK